MEFVQPQPFEEALAKLSERSPIASTLNSEQWRDVPVALRETSFFSSKVENVRFLQRAQNNISDFLASARDPDTGALKTGSRAAFVQQLQKFALAEGMGPLKPEDKGTLKDITSEKRLGLIFDVHTQSARDYGNWKQGMDPAVLDEFPAQRFVRVRTVRKPRPYHQAALNQVRLKTDLAFWLSLNRDFNVPWGPWGYGSGCDVEDVDRDAAERLGLLQPGERVTPMDRAFNDGLQASLQGLDQGMRNLLRDSFGDQVVFEGDTVRWRTKEEGAPQPEPEPKPAPPAPAPQPEPQPQPEPDPVPQQPEKANTLDEALQSADLDQGNAATAEKMRDLVDSLRESDPVQAADKLASWKSPLPQSGPAAAPFTELARDRVMAHAQSFMDLIPRSVTDTLPAIHWVIDRSKSNGGSYTRDTTTLTLSAYSLAGADAAEVKATVWHELMHWLYFHGTADFRAAIATHFQDRTAGEAVHQLPGYVQGTVGQEDDWYEAYAGRRYGPPVDAPRFQPAFGLEVPTRYVELLTKPPAVLAAYWNTPAQRETLMLVLSAFFPGGTP